MGMQRCWINWVENNPNRMKYNGNPTVKHYDFAIAEKEAERIAIENPGLKVITFESVSRVYVPTPDIVKEKVTVQRDSKQHSRLSPDPAYGRY